LKWFWKKLLNAKVALIHLKTRQKVKTNRGNVDTHDWAVLLPLALPPDLPPVIF